MNTICDPTGLIALCTEPSDRSDSNHPSLPGSVRVCVFSSGSTTDRAFILVHHVRRDQCGTSVSPLSRRLTATTGRIEFTCVSDQSFAFRCSPPRLTATQLRSATESNSNLLTGTCTLPIQYTHNRTAHRSENDGYFEEASRSSAPRSNLSPLSLLNVSDRSKSHIRRLSQSGHHMPC